MANGNETSVFLLFRYFSLFFFHCFGSWERIIIIKIFENLVRRVLMDTLGDTSVVMSSPRGGFMKYLLFLVILGFANPSPVAAMNRFPGGDDFDPASDTEGNDCYIQRFDVHLNDLYDVSEQIIGPAPCGTTVHSGEFYIPFSSWMTNTAEGSGDQCFPDGFALCYPEGYVPLGSPMEDFLQKLETITYLVDGKKTYEFSASSVEEGGVIKIVAPLNPAFHGEFAVLLAKLPPLPVGPHSVTITWHLSEMHCDGYSEDPITCIEGEVSQPTRRFDVLRSAAQSQ